MIKKIVLSLMLSLHIIFLQADIKTQLGTLQNNLSALKANTTQLSGSLSETAGQLAKLKMSLFSLQLSLLPEEKVAENVATIIDEGDKRLQDIKNEWKSKGIQEKVFGPYDAVLKQLKTFFAKKKVTKDLKIEKELVEQVKDLLNQLVLSGGTALDPVLKSILEKEIKPLLDLCIDPKIVQIEEKLVAASVGPTPAPGGGGGIGASVSFVEKPLEDDEKVKVKAKTRVEQLKTGSFDGKELILTTNLDEFVLLWKKCLEGIEGTKNRQRLLMAIWFYLFVDDVYGDLQATDAYKNLPILYTLYLDHLINQSEDEIKKFDQKMNQNFYNLDSLGKDVVVFQLYGTKLEFKTDKWSTCFSQVLDILRKKEDPKWTTAGFIYPDSRENDLKKIADARKIFLLIKNNIGKSLTNDSFTDFIELFNKFPSGLSNILSDNADFLYKKILKEVFEKTAQEKTVTNYTGTKPNTFQYNRFLGEYWLKLTVLEQDFFRSLMGFKLKSVEDAEKAGSGGSGAGAGVGDKKKEEKKEEKLFEIDEEKKATVELKQADFEEIKVIIDLRKASKDLLIFDDPMGSDEDAGVNGYRLKKETGRYSSIYNPTKGYGIFYGIDGVAPKSVVNACGGGLHEKGHSMSTELLKIIFFNATIWYYYTYKFLHFLISFNYEVVCNKYLYLDEVVDCRLMAKAFAIKELKTKKGSLPHIFEFTEGDVLSELLDLVKNIRSSLEIFKKNKLLNNLGIAYQRWKVVLEKLPKSGSENIKEARRIADTIATDLQIMIYHLMKQAYAKFVENYTSAKTIDLKKQSGNFLATFEPNFKDHAYYKNIIANIGLLMKPVTNLNTIPLPK